MPHQQWWYFRFKPGTYHPVNGKPLENCYVKIFYTKEKAIEEMNKVFGEDIYELYEGSLEGLKEVYR